MTFNDCVDFAIRADDIIFEGTKDKNYRTKTYTGRAANMSKTILPTTVVKQIPQSEID